MDREEVNKVVHAVCDYFKIDINKLSLEELNGFYSYVYHLVTINN